MKTSAIVIKLTYPILLLALLAAGAGIFWQRPGNPSEITTLRGETFELFGRGLYRYDTLSYAAQGIGQDAATLLVGIPLLFLGLWLARKGSLRGELLLADGLGYMLYTTPRIPFYPPTTSFSWSMWPCSRSACLPSSWPFREWIRNELPAAFQAGYRAGESPLS